MSANTNRPKDDVTHWAEGFFGSVKKILQERRATHPDPLAELEEIARLWSAYLGRGITPADAATMMLLLKIARARLHEHDDNEYDMAGYAFLRHLAIRAGKSSQDSHRVDFSLGAARWVP